MTLPAIAQFLPGHETLDASTRCLHPLLIAEGWQAWLDAVVKPVLERSGARRIALWNPFGRLPDGNYELNQRAAAKRIRDLRKVVSGFTRPFRRLIRDYAIEVIVYLGTLDAGPNDFRLATDPWLEAGCNLGFDAAVAHIEGSVAWDAIHDLWLRRERRCYIEGWPRAEQAIWCRHGLPVVTTTEQDPGVPREMIRGELVILDRWPRPETARRIAELGATRMFVG